MPEDLKGEQRKKASRKKKEEGLSHTKKQNKVAMSLRQQSTGEEFIEEVQNAEDSAHQAAEDIRRRFAAQRACDVVSKSLTPDDTLRQISLSVLNARGTDEKCALHVATEGGKLEIVRMLLELGCNPFVVDGNGETCLFVASKVSKTAAVIVNERRLSCCRALLESCCSTATTTNGSGVGVGSAADLIRVRSDKDGSTVLHRACFHDNEELVDLLLEYDADVVHQKNNRGISPLSLSKTVSALQSIQSKLAAASAVVTE